MGIRKYIFRKFEKPTGLVGKLTGRYMAFENRRLNKWTTSLLNIQDGESIVEIGYGPGKGIEYICRKFPTCHVTGYDISADMKKHAESRNEQFVKEGRVVLYDFAVALANENSGTYDKAYSVNSIFIWKDPVGDLQTVKNWLKDGGSIAITLQPHEKGADDVTAEENGKLISLYLKQAGFKSITVHTKEMKPVNAVTVTALK
ncbi:class I SAM-dependent methyltransferase [Fictibacillus iocasae]|uniref:Class I SAM-dependent methyltransferase n=1 Tax=Fictibacillus iocasae TaxID=2715437 RepID=A0ABW2P015_9BACL